MTLYPQMTQLFHALSAGLRCGDLLLGGSVKWPRVQRHTHSRAPVGAFRVRQRLEHSSATQCGHVFTFILLTGQFKIL